MVSVASIAPGVRRIKQAALARELGVSRQAINDLQARGIIPRSEDGLIDVDLARHAIGSRVHPSGKTVEALNAPPSSPESRQDDEKMSYNLAKTLREVSEARMAQLKLRQMQGELVSMEKVRAASMRMSRMLRDSVLGVPSRIAQTLATETDSHKIEQSLQEALRRALDDISKLNEDDIRKLET
jgi:phage terminase Nu1 subunit (DNA packaging protein)